MTWLVTKLFAWEGRRVRAGMLHAMIMLCSMDSCRDVPQYTVMKYHVFGIISSSLLSELHVMISEVGHSGVYICS